MKRVTALEKVDSLRTSSDWAVATDTWSSVASATNTTEWWYLLTRVMGSSYVHLAKKVPRRGILAMLKRAIPASDGGMRLSNLIPSNEAVEVVTMSRLDLV